MKKTIFLTVWNVTTKPSAMNRSVFKQANTFVKNGYNPVILTFDFIFDYPQIERELHAVGLLDDRVRILNVYDYYREAFNEQSMSAEQKAYYENSIQKFEEGYWVEDDGATARYFINGVYTKYKRWDKNCQLMIVDEFDDNRVRMSRREFHPEGFLARETLYHPANNKRNQERYFTRSGFCYLTIWYNNETDRQQSVFLFDPAFSKAEVFSALRPFHTYWIDQLTKIEAVKPIVIAQKPSAVDRLQLVENDNVSRIFMRHTSHLAVEQPENGDVNFAKDVASLLEVIPKGYPIVVTTELQKRHLEKHVGDRGNIFVMPDYFESYATDVSRKTKHFVSISSYDSMHATGQLLDAFKIVLETVPDATLSLYGKLLKPRKEAIMKKMKRLEITKSVSLNQYTLNIDPILAEATAQIVMSKTEGQGASIGEAFANGTPVIAYDVPFGAQEMINGQNGVLVEFENVDALAQAMIDLATNEDKARQMSAAAKAYADEYLSKQRYTDNWLSLLDHIEQYDPKEPLI